ncbi:acetyltransferase (GNAT) domain-containing protein [Purpureocillium lavendulum]|uniref:Acetyltransferase (GNAT) domain-containing protein n=1 Tax=Purpureocillium lavendulum TaxID=1247861 RepID=A0AB34G1E8_9HYPO|nr:acetyltransferase (GNAT) domain-containing protein [Purpureocillium lavendulum]
MADSPLLRMPPEIRLIIYEHLLDAGDSKVLNIRNRCLHPQPKTNGDRRLRRTIYNSLEPMPGRRSCKTTYVLVDRREIAAALLAVNRKIRSEASTLLYAKHCFHFDGDIEAAIHLLGDLSMPTRGLVQHITLRKRSLATLHDGECPGWAHACELLQTLPRLRTLSIVVEGGKPRAPWDGPTELSVSDLQLLYATRHEALHWVRALAGLDGLERLEISADLAPLPMPRTSATLIFAALSGSIETTLVEFLRSHLGLPAVAVPRAQSKIGM